MTALWKLLKMERYLGSKGVTLYTCRNTDISQAEFLPINLKGCSLNGFCNIRPQFEYAAKVWDSDHPTQRRVPVFNKVQQSL
jgi:hypothetical protein